MTTSPAEVARSVLDGVCRLVTGDASQVERLAALYAETTFVVHPMSPVPMPPLRTRDDLRRHFAEGPGRARAERFEAVDVTVHETADPEVVVTEAVYLSTRGAVSTHIPFVFVTRVRDGLIVESHDYGDHVAMARSAGRLDDLCASLTSGGSAPSGGRPGGPAEHPAGA